MSFQAEIPLHVVTLTATAAIVAGDPVTANGAKATGVTDFFGIALSDAADGENFPVGRWGTYSVQVDSSSTGVAVGDPITYATDGYDDAGVGNGFATALDAGVASGFIRVELGHHSAA